MIYWLISILFSILFLPSCDNSHNNNLQETVSIAYLKSLCKGDHYNIVNDYTIQGTVVATDWLGELNKSLIIMDDSGGLEVAIDCPNIYKHLPIYSDITIFCQGLTLARIGGKIELGASPTGEFPLDNMDEKAFNRTIRVLGTCADFAPATKRISEICASDISSVVRIENLRICSSEQGMTWCNTDNNREPITTYHTFLDKEGNSIAIRTLPSCSYALEEIPTNEITVAGIVDFSDNHYFLRIINKSIIQ